MSQMTPKNLIDNNEALINRDILPSLMRQMEYINPVLSQFTKTGLDPKNTEHVKAYMNTAGEVFPVEGLAAVFDDNVSTPTSNAAESRPANFSVPMDVTPDMDSDRSNEQQAEHDRHNPYDMTRSR